MSKSEMDIYFQFIELLDYWQGTVNTTGLTHYFKMGRQQSQKYRSQHQKNHPDNQLYCQTSLALSFNHSNSSNNRNTSHTILT